MQNIWHAIPVVRFGCFAVALFFAAAASAHAEPRIDFPVNDTIVTDDSLTVTGTANPAPNGTQVDLAVEGAATYKTVVVAGKWMIQNVNVPDGTSVWSAAIKNEKHEIVVVKGKKIQNQAVQKIRFMWGNGVDEKLQELATSTLEVALGADELEAFVTGVKAKAAAVFLRAYSGFNVTLVNNDGPTVHTVFFLDFTGDIFGRSPYDCGSLVNRQESQVWVGTYTEVISSFFADPILGWQPMDKNDSLHQRIIDIGEALGRTAAHEVGHSVGLVGSIVGTPCGWMRGCAGGHNCDEMDNRQPLINRFDGGFFIMDPGEKTANNARIAEALRTERSLVRKPAAFNRFNRSYLQIVHPGR